MTQLKKITLIAVTVCSFNLSSQNTNWIRHEKSKDWDVSGNIKLDQSGNIYALMQFFADSVYIDNTGFKHCGPLNNMLVKYSPAGQVIWIVQLCSHPTDMIMDQNGDLIISTSDALLKYDQNGKIVWQSSAGKDAQDIACDPNGNIYSTVPLNLYMQSAFKIKKFSPAGNFIWEVASDTVQFAEINEIAADNVGNVFIQGTTRHTLTIGSYLMPVTSDFSSFISKIDAAGNVQWAKQNYGWMIASQMEFTSSGQLIIAGESDWGFSVVGSDTIKENEWFIGKYDVNGNNIWINPTSALGVSFSLRESTIFTGGHYFDTCYFYKNALKFYCKRWGFYIMKLDSNGQVLKHNTNCGSGKFQFLNQICADQAGNLVTTGWFTDTLNFVGQLVCTEQGAANPGDIFIAKISDELTTAIEKETKEPSMTIFPNPSNSIFNFEFDSGEQKVVSVFDLVGSAVFCKATTNKTIQVDLSGKPTGVYLVKVHSQNLNVVKKVILE